MKKHLIYCSEKTFGWQFCVMNNFSSMVKKQNVINYYPLPKDCFGVVCQSFLFPSVHWAMDYGKLTKGTLWSHLPPTTDQVGKLSVACKDLRKALIMALNPIQTKINRLQTTDSINLWNHIFLCELLFWRGIWIFSTFTCFTSQAQMPVLMWSPKQTYQFSYVLHLSHKETTLVQTKIICAYFFVIA